MNKVTVRRCTEDDLSVIAELERSAFSDPWTRNSLLTMADSEHYHLLCAEECGIICGYLAASSVLGECEILRVAVSQERRRRGIGSAMLDCFINARTEAGDCEFFLEVRASNTPAIALYASRGFEICGKRKAYYKCPTEDAVLMRRCTSAANDK